MLAFLNKLTRGTCVVTGALNAMYPVICAFYWFNGGATMIWYWEKKIFHYSNIILMAILVALVFHLVVVRAIIVPILNKLLHGKPQSLKATVFMLIWTAGCTLIGLGLFVPFHSSLRLPSEYLVPVLTSSLVASNFFSSALIYHIPDCHIRYSDNVWAVAISCLLPACSIGFALFVTITVDGYPPHAILLVHVFHALFYGPIFTDFCVILMGGLEMGPK